MCLVTGWKLAFGGTLAPQWPLDLHALFGPEQRWCLGLFVFIGCLVSGVLIGIVGAQLKTLGSFEEPPSVTALLDVVQRLRRTFAALALLLSLATFSTDRFYEGIRQLFIGKDGKSPYEFTHAVTLHYGLMMSFLLVLFFLPAVLLYYQRAQGVLEQCLKAHSNAREEQSSKAASADASAVRLSHAQHAKDDLEHHQALVQRLGLTALSGFEGIAGALGPIITAVLSTGKAGG
jgi:hypothetical protein